MVGVCETHRGDRRAAAGRIQGGPIVPRMRRLDAPQETPECKPNLRSRDTHLVESGCVRGPSELPDR